MKGLCVCECLCVCLPSVCVYTSVCLCVSVCIVCVCVPECMHAEVTVRHLPHLLFTLIFETRSLTEHGIPWLCWTSWLTSKPQESFCIHLPRVALKVQASAHSLPGGFWGLNLGLQDYKANTVMTEPSACP